MSLTLCKNALLLISILLPDQHINYGIVVHKYKDTFNDFIEILGLEEESTGNANEIDDLMKMVLDIRKEAKTNKNYALSDKIRDELKAIGFEIMDSREGATYKKI